MKKKDPSQVEKQLIPRLRAIGYLLLVFSATALSYRFTLPPTPESNLEFFDDNEAAAGLSLLDEEGEDALLPTNPTTYYIFSSVFALVGLFCIRTARRKKEALAHQESDPD